MARQARGFENAAPIDAHIHDDGTFTHAGNHRFAHKHWGTGTGATHSTNGYVRGAQGFFEHGGLQRGRPEPLADRILQADQSVDRVVEDFDTCTET